MPQARYGPRNRVNPENSENSENPENARNPYKTLAKAKEPGIAKLRKILFQDSF